MRYTSRMSGRDMKNIVLDPVPSEVEEHHHPPIPSPRFSVCIVDDATKENIDESISITLSFLNQMREMWISGMKAKHLYVFRRRLIPCQFILIEWCVNYYYIVMQLIWAM